ncbi:hypothetical protein E2C01_030877 [Portunus trituberculatus]|uniref:Uncharacterized protein n=1 Tax=Portunus trituberculatus TaxID=210409 RepID=A0A5B7ET14_PORTR|nr:hypothetical protein [Portunus trituberculatus]
MEVGKRYVETGEGEDENDLRYTSEVVLVNDKCHCKYITSQLHNIKTSHQAAGQSVRQGCFTIGFGASIKVTHKGITKLRSSLSTLKIENINQSITEQLIAKLVTICQAPVQTRITDLL